MSWCGTPRYVFNDLPLGNPLGRPYDEQTQRKTVEIALELAASATQPGTCVETAVRWSDDDEWKSAYARVDESNRAELLKMGEANRRHRQHNRSEGLVRD